MNINLTTAINSLSYGYVGFNMLKALYLNGNDVSLFPIQVDGSVANCNDDITLIQQSINKGATLDYNAPSVRIWHQHQLAQHAGRGTRVGFPIFELDTFTDVEKLHLSNQDVLFVPSSWAKSVIEANDITVPTKVVPLGVDTDIFSYSKPLRTDNKYRFLNIGKWEIRKGHDFLIECFNEAFDEKDDVELVMCPTNMFINQQQVDEWTKLYKNSKLGDKVTILGRLDNQHQIAKLISSCDCGVFPARAEGWNLGLLECMAMGKPVITTNSTAHTEFCNENNSYLVFPTELEPAYDGVFFHGQGNWAALDDTCKEQCIDHMRFCYKERISFDEEGVKTGLDYSWKKSAEILVNNLN